MQTLSKKLLELLTSGLPITAGEVSAWATQISPLMLDVQPGDRLEPLDCWRDRVLARLPSVAAGELIPLWAQALSFAWAGPPRPVHGSIEFILLHWWSRIPAHNWPASWPVSAASMALNLGWRDLPNRMLDQPIHGLALPPLDKSLCRQLKLDPIWFETLRARALPQQRMPPWKAAGHCQAPADLEALTNQDVTVPLPSPEEPHPSWPERIWPINSVGDWVTMEKIMQTLRRGTLRGAEQHESARHHLMVRALDLGEKTLAHELGWIQWLKSADPLTTTSGPGEPRRSVLDDLGRNKQLSHPERLDQTLDDVFQPALEHGRLDLWRGTAEPMPKNVSPPGLRFWNRALGDSLRQRLKPCPGSRGPNWWRALMQERADLWRGGWMTLAPTSTTRWLLWWNMTVVHTTGNPLDLAAVVALGAPSNALFGGPFPWESLSSRQEQAWVTACAQQLNWLQPTQWDEASVRGAVALLISRLRHGQHTIWIPFVLTWLGMLAAVESPEANRTANRWWSRLEAWVHRQPESARGIPQSHQFWATISDPSVHARWREIISLSDLSPLKKKERTRA